MVYILLGIVGHAGLSISKLRVYDRSPIIGDAMVQLYPHYLRYGIFQVHAIFGTEVFDKIELGSGVAIEIIPGPVLPSPDPYELIRIKIGCRGRKILGINVSMQRLEQLKVA